MVSKKFQRHIDKYKEQNYAVKTRKLEKSDLIKHQDRSGTRKATEASGGDILIEGREIQPEAKEEVEFIYKPPENTQPLQMGVRFMEQKEIADKILSDSWVVNLRDSQEDKEEIGKYEDVREENFIETHQERRQRVSSTDQGRRKVKESDHETEAGEEEVKEKEKMTPKEKKHEAKETKKHERMEDLKETKKKESPKKK